MLRFIIPLTASSLFQQLYSLADSLLLGRFVSQDALAAIGACGALTMVFIMIATGAGIGASVPASVHYGERRYGAMRQSVSTSMVLIVGLSVFLAILGLVMGRTFLLWINTPPEVIDMSALYLRIYFAGFPFLFLYNIMASMFNALGDAKTPLYLLIFSTITNVVLDVVMIYFLGMGVAGAAFATVIAQSIAAILSLWIFIRKMKTFPQEAFRYFDGKECREIVRIALPSIVQQSTISIGILLVQSVLNGFGHEALAGYTAASTIDNLAFAPITAISGAMTPFTSQNRGAGKPERISEGLKACFEIMAAVAVFYAVVFHVFDHQMAGLFLGDEGTAIAYQTAQGYLRYIGWFYLLVGMKHASDGALRGLGYMKMFMIGNLVNLSIRVLVSMFCAPSFGIGFVWYPVPIGWLVNFLISYGEYRRRKPEFMG